jgi:hypothetical protein
MRKKFLFGEKKAVVTSVLAVLIICFASTAVPATNGSKTLDIVDNKCKILTIRQNDDAISDFYEAIQRQDDISYGDVFSYIKNNLVGDNNKIFLALINQMENIFSKCLDKNSFKVPSSVFKQMQEFIGSPDMTKSELLQVLRSKIIPLYKEIQKIVVGEKPMEQMSPDLKNLLEISGNYLNPADKYNSQSSYLGDPKSDFDMYWENYMIAQAIWGEYIGADNFEDYYQWADKFYGILADISVIFAFAIFITYLPPGFNFAPLIFLATLSIVNIFALVHYIDAAKSFFDLTWMEVDIAIRLIDNQTKQGIPNLAGSIVAYSVNVKNDHESYIHQFTYKLGYERNAEEPGWYTLKRRPGPHYELAPPPPGTWAVTIDDGYGPYKPRYLEFDIEKNSAYVMENVTLYRDT